MRSRKSCLPNTDITVELLIGPGGCSPQLIDDVVLRRVEKVYLKTWAKIPCKCRELIDAYWCSHREWTPRIELACGFINQDPFVLATTAPSGFEIDVRWEICANMTDDVLEALIAHEMAHVYQSSLGIIRQNLKMADLPRPLPENCLFKSLSLRDEAIEEIHADQTMNDWGYDYLAWLTWAKQQYFEPKKWHADWIPRKRPLSHKRAKSRARLARRMSHYEERQGGRVRSSADGPGVVDGV